MSTTQKPSKPHPIVRLDATDLKPGSASRVRTDVRAGANVVKQKNTEDPH